MKAAIKAIEYAFPAGSLDNEQLAAEFPDWGAEKIEAKTGIRKRHIAREDECASDLGFVAAEKLFKSGVCTPSEIDYLLVCTQSPDHFLPTTACILQHRLGLPTSCGALDFNLGCSGFVYGLSLAKALIENGQAKQVLFITAETYSKFIHPKDKSARTIFGDAAAATLVTGVDAEQDLIGPFVFGTDGAGAKNLIVPAGGMRTRTVAEPELIKAESGNERTINNLFMNGPEIFNFTIRVVPLSIQELLKKSGRTMEEIDVVVMHQANQFMLEHLRKKMAIPAEKFVISMADCGNTVSSTIPIALKDAMSIGRIEAGQLILVSGFGVGYSWASTLVRIPQRFI